jgi:macrolide-specific efflux system membrane fusion protein
LAVVVAVVGVAGLAIAVVGPGKAPAERYLTATVQRGEVVREAVADGTVQTTATYGLAFGRSPQLVVSGSAAAAIAAPPGLSWHVLEVLPTPGQEVSAGTVLAVADTGLAQQQLITAQANLAAATARLALDKAGLSVADRAAAFGAVRQAQAQLAQVQVSLSSTRSQNGLAVEQAQAALGRANKKYTDDVTAGAPQEVRDADQRAITAAQDALDTATARSTAATSSAQSAVANASIGLSAAQQALSDTQSQNNTALLQAQGAYNSALQALLALEADSSSGTEAIAAQRAAVESAAAALQTAQARANATNNAAQAQVTIAQAQLSQAQQASASSGSQNDLAVGQAQAAVSRAQHQLSDDLAKGAPKAVIDADQTAITGASDGLASAKARASAANEAARAQLRSASAALAAAQDAYAARVAPVPAAQIDADRAQVAAARQSVMTAQEAVTNGILVAPVDGTVVAVNLEPGVDAPAGYAILLQSDRLRVVADFAETDKPALSLGLPASVEISPLHVTVDGTVSEISPVASGPGVGQSVVTYEVVVDLPNPPAGTAVGMSAHAAISTSKATDVLVVPSIAVQGSRGDYTVRILDAQGKAQATPVEVGLASQSVTEIKSGLTEGQTVVVGTTSDRTRVNFSGGGGFGAPTESPPTGSGSAP